MEQPNMAQYDIMRSKIFLIGFSFSSIAWEAQWMGTF